MERQVKRCLLVLLITVFVLQMAFCVQPAGYKAFADSEYDTVLAFTSDVHNGSGNESADRLGGWIDGVKTNYGKIDAMGFCGDMGSARNNSTTEAQFWSYVQPVVDVVNSKNINAVYTTGNHEFSPGKYNSTTNSLKSIYTVDAAGPSGDNYLIYCMGTYSSTSDNYDTSQINKLSQFIGEAGTDKPIIVITHFPLHYLNKGNQSRTTVNANRVIDALNAGVAQGKKIVLLWGHNHSKGDPHYDQVYAPGEVIEYASGSSETINFYYAAAGCMSDTEYVGSSSVYGKGLVITIDDDTDRLSFTYLNANMENVTTFYEPVPTAVEGVSVTPKTLELKVGRLKTLTATITPEGATNKAVTWTSDNEEVARVTNKGMVTGISPGTATITATTDDGEFQDTCQVTVTGSTGPTYFVIMDDKGYALSSLSAGDPITNSSGYQYEGLKRVAYSPSDPAPANILWTIAPAGQTGRYQIMSYYGDCLRATYEGVNSPNTSPYKGTLAVGNMGDTWTISSDLETWKSEGCTLMSANCGKYLSTTSDIQISGRETFFTVRSNGSKTKIVEPEQILEPVVISEINVEPKEMSLKAGRTASITATLLPENADDKTVYWYSNNTEVATVSDDGVVTAHAPGTAVITVAARTGEATATCTVTVEESSGPQYYVIKVGELALTSNRTGDYMSNNGYEYHGLESAPYDGSWAAPHRMLWTLEYAGVENGYYIKSYDGEYLSASYQRNPSSNGYIGNLAVGEEPDIWIIQSGLDTWELDGSLLKSTNGSHNPNNNKEIFIGLTTGNGGSKFFTARSKDNASTTIGSEPKEYEGTPSFSSQSLVLSGKIGVNFNMDLPEIEGVNYADSYMTFDITGKGTVEERQDFDPTRTNRSGTLYTFTCYVNSIQMADTITATFHYTEDGKQKAIEKTYSVKEYIEGFDAALASNASAFDAKTIALVHALADYGHYVQPFLSEARSWTIGTDYAEMDLVYANSYDLETIKSEVAYKGIERNISGTDIEKITYSLTLDSDTAINLYFKMAEGYSGKFEAKIGEDTATPELLSDGRYRVRIKGISAHLLAWPYNVSVTTENGSATVKVSALSYVHGLLATEGASDVYNNAAAAIYSYWKAADEYLLIDNN